MRGMAVARLPLLYFRGESKQAGEALWQDQAAPAGRLFSSAPPPLVFLPRILSGSNRCLHVPAGANHALRAGMIGTYHYLPS